MSGTDFLNSYLGGMNNAYFQNAKCVNCYFLNSFKSSFFRNSNLTNSQFSSLDLTDTDFTGANLTDVSFFDASYYGDKEIQLRFTIFEDATVDGISFSESTEFYWHQVKWTDGERYDYNPTTTAD